MSDVTTKNVKEDQCPHVLKLIIQASTSLVAVFLIALDQVGSLLSFSRTSFAKWISDYHWYLYIQAHRRVSRYPGDVWYADTYFMTFGPAHTSAGKLYKYYNLKWTFLSSMLIFEVGSLIGGVAPNFKSLVVGLAIAGVGGAGRSVGGTSIIALSTPT
jgi:MFS family permease